MKLGGGAGILLLLLSAGCAELRAQTTFDNIIDSNFNVHAGPPAVLAPKIYGDMKTQLRAFHQDCIAASQSPQGTAWFTSGGVPLIRWAIGNGILHPLFSDPDNSILIVTNHDGTSGSQNGGSSTSIAYTDDSGVYVLGGNAYSLGSGTGGDATIYNFGLTNGGGHSFGGDSFGSGNKGGFAYLECDNGDGSAWGGISYDADGGDAEAYGFHHIGAIGGDGRWGGYADAIAYYDARAYGGTGLAGTSLGGNATAETILGGSYEAWAICGDGDGGSGGGTTATAIGPGGVFYNQPASGDTGAQQMAS